MSRMRITALFLLATAAWVFSLTPAETVQAVLPDTDIEATRDYIIYNENRTLMRYDPVTGEHRVIVDGLESVWSTFVVNSNGLVAFADSTDGDAEIYVVDSSLENPTPQLLIDRPSTHDRPLAWSRDGRYLAFASELVGNEDDHVWLYVWDGEHAINITPSDLPSRAEQYNVYWGYDGQLAFVVTPITSQEAERYPIVYVWYGNEISGLRLEESYDLYSPLWLRNGSLALSYIVDEVRYVGVWSEDEVQNGQLSSHDPIITLPIYPSAWVITPDDTFMYTDLEVNRHVQLYLVDGEETINISQNGFHNSVPQFGLDGRYAYSTYFSSEQLVFIRDKNHNLIWSEEGSQMAWGNNGYLIFCTYGATHDTYWQISIWDGSDTETIYSDDSGTTIRALWQKTGQSITCSSG